LLGQRRADALVEPIEIEWKRKDQTTLKVRLSGREVVSENGNLEAYEIIVEDVTRQRELEDHLRRQAARDSLTGLPTIANSWMCSIQSSSVASARTGSLPCCSLIWTD
jgi:hypothetical protein